MPTFNLTPDATFLNTSDWDLVGGGSFHANMADADDGTGMRTDSQSEFVDMTLTNFTPSHTTIDSVRHYIRGFKFNTRGGDTEVQVVIIGSGGSPLYTENHQLLFNGYTPQDFYGTARTDIDGNPAHVWEAGELNALRLNVNTIPEDPPSPSYAQFVRAYIEVTYDSVAVAVDNATFFGANF